MSKLHHRPIVLPRICFVFGLAAATAACLPPPANPDYRETHPLKAELTTSRLTVRFVRPAAAPPVAGNERFRLFVRDFQRRARSPMLVSVRAGDKAFERMVRGLLIAEGITAGRIIFTKGARGVARARAAVLSFRGYAIKAPDCADWSGWAGLDPTNGPHTNYGCAFQRNIGLMLADPGDLVRSREPRPPEARRTDRVVTRHRAGELTGSATPTGEKGTISGIK